MILDDDKILQNIIYNYFCRDYEVIQCETIKDAQKCLNDFNISLFIIDRSLPDGDGLEFCKILRENIEYSDKPIIFLSGLVAENDAICALAAGGDDYIRKPFSIIELKMKVEKRLRVLKSKIIEADLEIDMDSQTVKLIKGNERTSILLTRIEFKILLYLIEKMNCIQSRESLINKVWGSDLNVTDRVIDAHVSHIRKKILKSRLTIVAVRGEGYRLVA